MARCWRRSARSERTGIRSGYFSRIRAASAWRLSEVDGAKAGQQLTQHREVGTAVVKERRRELTERVFLLERRALHPRVVLTRKTLRSHNLNSSAPRSRRCPVCLEEQSASPRASLAKARGAKPRN